MTLPLNLSSRDWSLTVGFALLGGDGGGPRSGAVGGAQRSGPPLRGVDGGGQPAEPGVMPLVIVVGAPGFENSARMRKRPEQGLIEQLVTQAADEGFGKGVLHRLAWCDVVPGHLVIVGPLQDR